MMNKMYGEHLIELGNKLLENPNILFDKQASKEISDDLKEIAYLIYDK